MTRRELELDASRAAMEAIEHARPANQWEFWGTSCEVCGEERPMMRIHGCACACERKRLAKVEATYTAEHRPACVVDTIEAAAVPRRYQGCTFESFTRRNGTADAIRATQAWAEAFDLEAERGLLLSGPYGSGKTHLAVATLRRAIQRTLVAGRYISAGALVGAVRAGGQITWAPVERTISAELLVLDDLGQEAATEFTRDVVARVVFGRYEEARPTIITTNLGPQGLADVFGGAVVSRLHEMTEPLALKASDYRMGQR